MCRRFDSAPRHQTFQPSDPMDIPSYVDSLLERPDNFWPKPWSASRHRLANGQADLP